MTPRLRRSAVSMAVALAIGSYVVPMPSRPRAGRRRRPPRRMAGGIRDQRARRPKKSGRACR